MDLIRRIGKGMIVLGLVFSPWFSKNSFSQNVDPFVRSSFYQSVEKKKIKTEGGVKLGKILSKNLNGVRFEFYQFAPKFELGYIIERDLKRKEEQGLDLIKAGFEFSYFPVNANRIRPNFGLELRYENGSYFVGKENLHYKINGLGTGVKVGTEFNSFKKTKIGFFLDAIYSIYADKKSLGYPKNPKIKKDNFSLILGLKF